MDAQLTEKSKPRWGDWLSSLLLIILMQVAVGRLVATAWTKDLSLIQVTALLGSILGLTLGVSVFKRIWVVFFTFAYGIIIIPWQLGLTLDVEKATWLDRLNILQVRMVAVLQELLTHQAVTDSILFILAMAFLFWFLSVFSGVVLMRDGNPWKVIIPGGITVFVIHTFDPLLVSRTWYLAFYLFFALLLVARLVFVKNTAKWRERRTHTPPDMGFDFARVVLVLSMVLVFFAWNVPVVAETFKPAVDIWQTASRPYLTAKDRLSFMFASLRASVGFVQNAYGPSLPLGLGSPLSDSVVFTVQGPTTPPNGDRFYWEARTYDTYESNQWVSTIQSKKSVGPSSTDLNQPGVDTRPEVTFTFFPYDPISNLYTVPEPLWVNIPSNAYISTNPDSTVDYSTIFSQDFVHPGDQYEIRSAIDSATISQLKNAGTDYPKWVSDEYLQLPSNITQRTIDLGKSIAGNLTDSYDIANAVTDYLRNNIEYSVTISKPPSNQERIDWFLFDYKKGFCNYYASAEVILLRSVGIPARMAVGFAEGQKETPTILGPGGQSITNQPLDVNSTYVVRQKDAHAWPEVYFPGYGWIIFEPTTAQPTVVRPSGEIASPNERQQGAGGDTSQNGRFGPNNLPKEDQNGLPPDTSQAASFWTLGNILKLVLLLFAVAALIFVILQVRRGYKLKPLFERISVEVPERLEKGLRLLGLRPPEFLVNWVYYRRLPDLTRSYLEINRALSRVGKKPEVQDTPSERAAALISAIPEASLPANSLLAEYQASAYSPHPADSSVAKEAGKKIRGLSWRTWFNQLFTREE